MNRLLATALVLLLAGATSCSYDKSSTQAATGKAGATNEVCPISGKAVDTSVKRQFQGGDVLFCCPRCLEKWDGMTNDEKTAALAKQR